MQRRRFSWRVQTQVYFPKRWMKVDPLDSPKICCSSLTNHVSPSSVEMDGHTRSRGPTHRARPNNCKQATLPHRAHTTYGRIWSQPIRIGLPPISRVRWVGNRCRSVGNDFSSRLGRSPRPPPTSKEQGQARQATSLLVVGRGRARPRVHGVLARRWEAGGAGWWV